MALHHKEHIILDDSQKLPSSVEGPFNKKFQIGKLKKNTNLRYKLFKLVAGYIIIVFARKNSCYHYLVVDYCSCHEVSSVLYPSDIQ